MPNLTSLLNRLRERLWVKPMIACIVSVACVLLAQMADYIAYDWKVPEVAQGSLIDMLKIIAASMLGVATFAVASMVAAYGSTGQSATARAFPLVVADDVSQNALSIFIAAFIFAIVALTASSNGYYGKAGRLTLFVLTLLVLALVVMVFVRWVDSIARLGRLGAVIAKVEQANAEAMKRRRQHPCLGGMDASGPYQGMAFHSEHNGYLQRVDMGSLQRLATQGGVPRCPRRPPWRDDRRVAPARLRVAQRAMRADRPGRVTQGIRDRPAAPLRRRSPFRPRRAGRNSVPCPVPRHQRSRHRDCNLEFDATAL